MGIKCQILRNYHEMKILNSGEMLKLGTASNVMSDYEQKQKRKQWCFS